MAMVKISVDPNVSTLTSGILRAALYDDPKAKRQCRALFTESMLGWACRDLPKVFEVDDHNGLRISDCGGDGDLKICPHDEQHDAHIWRSAFGTQPVFPAFPHRWPFCDLEWKWRESGCDRKAPSVGFCGIPRPLQRRQAIEALLELEGVDFNYIPRQQFFGRELPNGRARREYLENLLGNDYTLCVRGVGNYCYRFYEALAAGRVPLFLDTDRPLPIWTIDGVRFAPAGGAIVCRNVAGIGDRLIGWHEGGAQYLSCFQRNNRNMWLRRLSPVGWWKHFDEWRPL